VGAVLELDQWQKEVLDCDTNIALRSGRQTGKSTVISIKAAEYALKNPNKLVMIVAAVERQAYLLFEKTLGYLSDNYKKNIATGKLRPTKHIIHLKNKSRIMCLPTGLTGYGIRGFTTDLLIVDEAAFVNREVFDAITPQLAVSGGKIVLLSTPFGKEGYFYDCFSNPSFKTWHISSEDCPRIDKEFLAREKLSKSMLVYNQEYLGEFVSDLLAFFNIDLIKRAMCLTPSVIRPHGDNYLGVDLAQMGGDETALVSLCMRGDAVSQFDMDITTKTRLTDTIRLIINKDTFYNYFKLYIDSGGLGIGVIDQLLEVEQTRRKVVPINNSQKSLTHDQTLRKKVIKEDLYTNLLRLLEQGKIKLFNDPRILLSLQSVQCEFKNGKMRIWSKYGHIVEALVRAAFCTHSKANKLWVR